MRAAELEASVAAGATAGGSGIVESIGSFQVRQWWKEGRFDAKGL